MAKEKGIEDKVIDVVRQSHKAPTPEQVIITIGGQNTPVRDAIVSLVDRGKLQVTLGWKLRVKEKEQGNQSPPA